MPSSRSIVWMVCVSGRLSLMMERICGQTAAMRSTLTACLAASYLPSFFSVAIRISAEEPSSERSLSAHVVDGVARSVGEESHLWMSDGFSSQGEWLQLALRKEVPVQEVRLTFDPNLSEERCISISKAFLDKEPLGVAKELVKDYTVELFFRGTCVWKREMQGNYQRHCVLEVPSVAADTVKISITATNGVPEARVFEVRVY